MISFARALIIYIFFVGISIADADSVSKSQPKIFPGSDDYPLAPRAALVIGVDKLADSSGIASLRNPRNDAAQVTSVLRKAGFLVTSLSESYEPEQMTRQNIKKAVYDFAGALQKIGGVGLIYYSGHGVERAGKLYLFPYDSYVRFDRDFDEELISATFLNDAFSFAKNPLNVLVIDACRDFPSSLQVSSFGAGGSPGAGAHASGNVVVAYSSLSGDKALDGSGTLSPYARAFADAFVDPDKGLSDFFASIGVELHTVLKNGQIADVANQNIIAGRDFVFVPTVVSFNRERAIYNQGIGSGNRHIIESLRWQYSGGYFYAAATKWLNDAPLAPAPPVSAPRIVEVVNDANLRSKPTLSSDVVATANAGTQLSIVGPTVSTAGSNWLPVRVSESSDEVAYVRNDHARIVPAKATFESIDLQFVPGTEAGTVKLNDDSLQELKEAISKNGSSILSTAVVGMKNSGSDASNSFDHALLARQAAAVSALNQLGVDTSRTGVSIQGTGSLVLDNSVSVEVQSYKSH